MVNSTTEHNQAETSAPSSTQSLDRAMVLLDIVAKHALVGVALGDAAIQSRLSKPTAHRLLNGLRNAALIDYCSRSRLFFPSFRLFQMGRAAGQRYGIVHQARPVLKQLAAITHDTVYLTLRKGDNLLCVIREIGDFPIKILTLEEGDERPIGLGSNGIAWLAAQDEVEFQRLLIKNQDALKQYPEFVAHKLKRYVAQARKNGFAFSRGFMMPEMSAMAMCVRDGQGQPRATVSVAAITSRFDEKRFLFVSNELDRHVRTLELMLFGDESHSQHSDFLMVY